ncbi:hypothetical protein, partial [Vibrio alginolyticus]|uniref:hypothetical protein n=1 Tax=Vibrio alginolyticus TaxID=663 RepID=UPI001A8BFCD3
GGYFRVVTGVVPPETPDADNRGPQWFHTRLFFRHSLNQACISAILNIFSESKGNDNRRASKAGIFITNLSSISIG